MSLVAGPSRTRRTLSLEASAVVLLLGAVLPRVTIAADPAIVRVTLAPSGSVWVGQRVTLQIEVLAETWFSRAPRFELPSTSGFLVFETGDRPVNTTTTIDGESYSGTVTDLPIFAQRPGEHVIPSFRVACSVAGKPGQPANEVTLSTDELRFTAKMPPGAENLSTLISTKNLEVTESWEPDVEEAKVGDAITRTVTFESPDVLGMAFPPLPDQALEGFGVYPRQPSVEDKVERGAMIGRRTERVTFVCEQPGVYRWPELVIPWWNLESERLERKALPARTLEVSPNPALVIDDEFASTPVAETPPWFMAGLVAALLTAVAVGWLRRGRIVDCWNDWRATYAERESIYFTRVQAACRSNDPVIALGAMVRWLDRIHTGPESATIAGVLQTENDPDLAREVDILQRAAIERESRWSGARLAAALAAVRKSRLRRERRARRSVLPPLNPRSIDA